MTQHEAQRRWLGRAEELGAYAKTCSVTADPVAVGNNLARYRSVSFVAPDGVVASARLIEPVTPGPHPVVLAFHDATRGVRGWHHLTRFAALGCAVLALQNRPGVQGVLVEEPLAVGDGLGVTLRVPTCPLPPDTGRLLDQGSVAALEATLSDALVLAGLAPRLLGRGVGPLVTWGEGLGAGLALAVARLASAHAACALNPLPAALDERCASVDVALVAAGLTCPVLMGTGLLDLQAPAAAQDIVAEALGNVRRLRYPRYAHERINAYEDDMLAFFGEVLDL